MVTNLWNIFYHLRTDFLIQILFLLISDIIVRLLNIFNERNLIRTKYLIT